MEGIDTNEETASHSMSGHNHIMIGEMQAQLQAQISLPLSRDELQRLRKQHQLPSYLRTKDEIFKHLRKHDCNERCVNATGSLLGKRRREEAGDDAGISYDWPYILEKDTKETLIKEYINATSNEAIKFVECSFCGILTKSSKCKVYAKEKLDISLLEKSGVFLRSKLNKPDIQIVKNDLDTFIVCNRCNSCVRRNCFISIPLYSYANGCWIGEVPNELKDLTFLEEICIARARTTRCTIKLSAGKYSQYATHGNVCVFPQEPKNLAGILPPPLSTIYDEIAVIFVTSNDTVITQEILNKSPLLVRRHKILKALQWLKNNNRFYSEIDISLDHLAQYPENSAPNNYPIQCIFNATAEGAGYSTYNAESNSAAIPTSNESLIQACGVLDTDRQENSYRLRKLEMAREIVYNQERFIKYPLQSSEPMKTSYNPSTYTMLWPTLFPYGIGSFEDDIRLCKDRGLRAIDLKRHVNHLLNIADTRFQKHITFPFVMMNLIQRKVSSFKSKLVLKRSWFPRVVEAMRHLDLSLLDDVKEKFTSKTPLGDSIQEKAVQTVLKHVNYVSEDVSGSISEVNRMRYEIRSIMRLIGLPHLFVTINPADTYNPVMQVYGGRQIDLNKIFDELQKGEEDFQRMKCSVSNPAAAARAFDKILETFIHVLLGMGRPNNIGIFGPTQSYYGVIEAQGRGSLHCHFFIWLKDGFNPFEIKERSISDSVWKTHFLEWLENIIQQDLPMDSSVNVPLIYKKKPLMCRPPDPAGPEFDRRFREDLRSVLELTGQVHEHSDTCYKHLPFIAKSRRDPNADCRFGLPREIVEHTFIDDEGHIHLRCMNGNVNGYNDVIVSCLRCNMDCKFIGSGTAALAMTEYITNYMAKISLDSSVVFSCLCAALNSMQHISVIDPNTNSEDSVERARILLLKICNGMIGKRELSGQQVMSFLQGIPNRYTNHTFQNIWWTSVLKFMSPTHFCTENEDSDDYVILNEKMLESTLSQEKGMHPLVLDYIYRPPELEETCIWDFWCNFKVDTRSRTTKDAENVSDCSDSPILPSKMSYSFSEDHPKYLCSTITCRSKPITPILSGIPIPRNDTDDDLDKYHISMLTLFRPWRCRAESLCPVGITWKTAFDDMWKSLSQTHRKIIHNFQSIHSCKDAAHDFSAKRRKRLNTLIVQVYQPDREGNSITLQTSMDDTDWMMAMQQETELETDGGNHLEHPLSLRVFSGLMDGVRCAEMSGFYSIRNVLNGVENTISQGTDRDVIQAKIEYEKLQALKERIRENRDTAGRDISRPYLEWNSGEPSQETFNLDELPSTKYCRNAWTSLHEHRKLCIHVIEKYTLNEEQALVFLLITDHYGQQYCIKPPLKREPLRLIISGPGGTGKSQIFQAIRNFFGLIGHSNRLKITAPTGLAANNIDGRTVHAEASLRVTVKDMLSENKRGQALRTNLEKRYENINTQIVDEIYFLGAQDNATLSQYIGLATCRPNGDSSYGNLNMIFAGDPAQLPPPKAMSLFDRRLVKKAETSVNALNDRMKNSLNGVITWRQIQDCIVLTKIMRQKDLSFQHLLNRLRFGNCTEEDYELLQTYVIVNRSLEENQNLLNIAQWIDSPENACPLITYTNAFRDIHNMRCAESFASHMGLEFHVYHSVDTVNKGKTVLQHQAAEAAWNTPVKQADDLSGRLPLIPSMPIFLTQNIATEMGLSNGASGTLIAAKFEIRDGKRYAISAEVEFEKYTHGSDEHPHRLLLKPMKGSITYRLPGREKVYHATRSQLPIIPAFAYTSHNSQSRSVNRACVDLESCPSTAAAYVMLSRVKSFSGLSILRPFSYTKISRHCPEETRVEIRQLEELSDRTKERSRTSLRWYYDMLVNDADTT